MGNDAIHKGGGEGLRVVLCKDCPCSKTQSIALEVGVPVTSAALFPHEVMHNRTCCPQACRFLNWIDGSSVVGEDQAILAHVDAGVIALHSVERRGVPTCSIPGMLNHGQTYTGLFALLSSCICDHSLRMGL